ncbi:MAG: hypothetical protein QOH71_2535 [Blastocatellia bacterium]|jgi:hypothetical protein|nr:hypothetical protein [Blastocatellia bacterium]
MTRPSLMVGLPTTRVSSGAVVGHEVSTGSGSDRVAASISSRLSQRNPVATAPGTDLLAVSNLKLEL